MSNQPIHITIDGKKYDLLPGLTSGASLRSLANIRDPEQLLFKLPGEPEIPVDASDSVLIHGGEQFRIGNGTPPLEDNPYLHRGIRVFMNGTEVPEDKAFHHAKVHPDDLKALDPLAKPGDAVYAELEGLPEEPLPASVRLILQPKDRFGITPAGNVGGTDLLQEQLEEVKAVHPAAYIEEEDGQRFLVVPDFRLPEAWGDKVVTLLVLITNGFPQTALDMFYVDPHIHLANGADPDRAQHREQHLGRQWQRFSWHYCNPASDWRPATSSLLSHLRFCATRFAYVA